MKKLLSLLLPVLLISCTKPLYHVASVQSEQVKRIEDDFVFENDELRVVYNLWEPGGRMRFLLFNKTDNPLYVDWSKSFFIRNDTKTRYSQLPSLGKQAYADTVVYTYQHIRAEPYRTTARNNPFTELPSQAYVAIADFPIQQVVLHAKAKERSFSYTKENSPLQFGQQLAYSPAKTSADIRFVEHTFWVNKIQLVGGRELTKQYGSRQKGQPISLYTVEKRPAPAQTAVLTAGIIAATWAASILLLKDLFSGFTF